MDSIQFRTYCGLSGDLQKLLIAEKDGISTSVLYTRCGIFKTFNYWWAKRKLKNRLKYVEQSRK